MAKSKNDPIEDMLNKSKSNGLDISGAPGRKKPNSNSPNKERPGTGNPDKDRKPNGVPKRERPNKGEPCTKNCSTSLLIM